MGPSSSAASMQSSTASTSSTVEVDPSASSIHSIGATATAITWIRSVDDPAAVKILEKWYVKNVCPSPSKNQLAALVNKTNLDRNQIERWLQEKGINSGRCRTNRALLNALDYEEAWKGIYTKSGGNAKNHILIYSS